MTKNALTLYFFSARMEDLRRLSVSQVFGLKLKVRLAEKAEWERKIPKTCEM